MFYSQEQFKAMQKKLATSYNVDSVERMFSVSAPRAVAIMNAIQQQIAFLSKVTVIPVTDIAGRVVSINAPSSVAGRTNTATTDRVAQVVGDKTERTYECKQTNFDVALRYSDIDAWRRFSDYEQRILNMIYRRIGLDQLTIGWYGQSCATSTDRSTYPLLQDVNHGWLYDLEENNESNFLKADTGEKLELGKGGDWENLDSLIFDLYSLIPEEHRTGNEVAIVGRQIVAWESGKIFSAHGQTPSEKVAFNLLAKTYGSLPAVTPPTFPDKGVMVTDIANLQIYEQEGSIRRQLYDNAKRDQVEHLMSQNECYRIGDLDGAAAVNYADIDFVAETTSTDTDTDTDTDTNTNNDNDNV